jgi:hypothetical protein
MTFSHKIGIGILVAAVLAGSLGGVYWYQQSHSSSPTGAAGIKTEKTLQQLALTRAAALLGVSEGEAGKMMVKSNDPNAIYFEQKEGKVWYEKSKVEKQESGGTYTTESWVGTGIYKYVKTANEKVMVETLENDKVVTRYLGGKYSVSREKSQTGLDARQANATEEWLFLRSVLRSADTNALFEKVRKDSIDGHEVDVYTDVDVPPSSAANASIDPASRYRQSQGLKIYYFVDSQTGGLLRIQKIKNNQTIAQLSIVSHSLLSSSSDINASLAFVPPSGIETKRVLASFSDTRPNPTTQFMDIAAKYALPIVEPPKENITTTPDYTVFIESTRESLENTTDFDPNYTVPKAAFGDSKEYGEYGLGRQIFTSQLEGLLIKSSLDKPRYDYFPTSEDISLSSAPKISITIQGKQVSAARVIAENKVYLVFQYQQLWYLVSTVPGAGGQYPEPPTTFQLMSPSYGAVLDAVALARQSLKKP